MRKKSTSFSLLPLGVTVAIMSSGPVSADLAVIAGIGVDSGIGQVAIISWSDSPEDDWDEGSGVTSIEVETDSYQQPGTSAPADPDEAILPGDAFAYTSPGYSSCGSGGWYSIEGSFVWNGIGFGAPLFNSHYSSACSSYWSPDPSEWPF